MKRNEHILSTLGKTWIFDLDGTVVKHNGYKIDGKDTLLEGAREFFGKIPKTDMIVFITSRTLDLKEETEDFLLKEGIRFDQIFWCAPFGERILINDKKPSGLSTALAINTERDKFMEDIFKVNEGI